MQEIQDIDLMQLQSFKTDLTRFMMYYKFAMDEINTKINILQQEFQYIHSYNPIEHVNSRLKTPESILKKVYRKGYECSLHSIKENIRDIAGIRIICSFISDIYEISNMLQKQNDIKLIECKDYIKNPKPNGYKSLHLILEIPIFMSDRVENICVEVQIRTIAMDFWASLEHKIYYKYDKEIPEKMLIELKGAADSVAELDQKMENIHKEMKQIKEDDDFISNTQELLINNEKFHIPYELFARSLSKIE
ncbi:RelA/SpoT domain-containing protein [Gottschalkia acidurici 9a]|uniref:RelA/SpoT domain-containing protein n=1 Tax=Gottschalkia acidurici (strain ATCC 7906 / DSM 604 / BCRC 14475 / CIP 104303 / KCTC 5404 / NCIMB 10678 / 9a) TaxID=1128398 RepID=K0AWI2_GOTA9|nr:GTP pyrophosphokinase family protein [Gottschalkia acidurici]AFS77594.1 RelA/SpoT domain-containing protein [Gottschalkia acidurici 9a]